MQSTRIIHNGQTGAQTIETYEIPDPTPEELAAAELAEQQRIIRDLTTAVQAHLDATARTRNYDGILSACTYATSTNSQFAAEGQACVRWRDACWFACYGVMNSVQLGGREMPTSEQLIAELPLMVWP